MNACHDPPSRHLTMEFSVDHVKSLIATRVQSFSAKDAVHGVVEVDGHPQLIVKYGPAVWKTEAIAMQLVREHTTVPVPRILSYVSERIGTSSRCGYIVMEKVQGVMLSSVIDTLDDNAVEAVSAQLASYLRELTKLDSAGWGMPGKKGMYHKTYFNFASGPARLQSTKEFIAYFASAADMPLPKEPAEANHLLQGIDLSRPPVFCHGDLVPENIMYDVARRQITAIIDWETAGCYPYFWNSFVARRRKYDFKNWEKIYSGVMESCPVGEILLQRYFFNADICGSFDGNPARFDFLLI